VTEWIRTDLLEIGYESAGPTDGVPVVLLHGFPYDVRSFDEVSPLLAAAGARVIVPYLRGYGPTRFLDDATMRSGQQAAIAQDLLDLLDALSIERAVVAGYDWGGRAACIAAAVAPERVAGLVTVGGYLIQDIAHAAEPASAEHERVYWYQWYLHTERGRLGLERNRDEICELLWREWSPTWEGAAAAFPASAASLHNRDFVEVAVHSYRHRYGVAAGDPRYAELEERLAAQPVISVPTVDLESGSDGVATLWPEDPAHFVGPYDYRLLPDAGHDVPQEDPAAFADAVLSLMG
jgi:pimeloyl-ACP methyl ester carboxylesterase